jgi:hypothetical protein
MSYIGVSPQFATQTSYRYTIVAAGTTIAGMDDLGKALTYTPGYVAVYVNGIKLLETLDYGATTGSTVVFVNTVQIGDTVEIIAYGSYSLGGPPGPAGPPGPWTQITQAAYNALTPPNPATLYVIVG